MSDLSDLDTYLKPLVEARVDREGEHLIWTGPVNGSTPSVMVTSGPFTGPGGRRKSYSVRAHLLRISRPEMASVKKAKCICERWADCVEPHHQAPIGVSGVITGEKPPHELQIKEIRVSHERGVSVEELCAGHLLPEERILAILEG